MGPVTHIAKVPMTIGNHQEVATLQVANLQNHEVILGMPWLKGHNPKIDWGKNKITFDSERCTTWCLDRKSMVHAIPEATAQEENLIARFSEIHNQQRRLLVKKVTPEARIPTKESPRAAGHDLYAQKAKIIPARGQAIIGTGIAIGLPLGTYGRIAPRSGLAAKHALAINAGVIDADYAGEVKVILVNLSDQDYEVHKEDKIAQLIVERIQSEEIMLVQDLEDTRRGTKGFGSSDKELTKQTGAGADWFSKPPSQKQQSSLSESLLQNDQQEVPRPHMMTKQSGAGAGLLNKQSCEVTGPADHSSPQNGRIHISEITQKEFRQAYRSGEITGVLKISQKAKQIYLHKINISTELAIRNKEEQRNKIKAEEDSLERLVPEEYHDLRQAFEKGEKTGLPPHRPGIDLEINMEEGKELPDQKIYPLGAEELERVQDYINKNQERGWIREAFTDGGSPIMFVKKKDGSLRLCVDYRALNEVTKKARYPLPLIGEALDRLHTAKYFTKLDIKKDTIMYGSKKETNGKLPSLANTVLMSTW